MIITPIIVNQETPKCPNCKKEEDIKEVCSHCGYEYSYKEESFIVKVLQVIVFIIGLILFIIFFTSIIEWIAQLDKDLTLIQIIIGKFKYLYHLKIF